MKWIVKKFAELAPAELYAIMALREQVFTFEQKCTEPDFDCHDPKAWQLMAFDGEKLAAYARIFAPGDYHAKAASFGRFVVAPEYRGQGLGQVAINKTLDFIQANFNAPAIEISAQSYLTKFYQIKGFQVISDKYDEGGISHQKMVLHLPATQAVS